MLYMLKLEYSCEPESNGNTVPTEKTVFEKLEESILEEKQMQAYTPTSRGNGKGEGWGRQDQVCVM